MSPYRLLQEQVSRDLYYPWRVIVSCALLNRTTGTAGHKAAGQLFEWWPVPSAWAFDFDLRGRATAERRDLTEYAHAEARRVLVPLGLANRRLELLHCMTLDYLAGISPYDCRGVGQYGRDALDVFCLGRLPGYRLADHYLQGYADWRRDEQAPRIEWDEEGYLDWLSGRDLTDWPDLEHSE